MAKFVIIKLYRHIPTNFMMVLKGDLSIDIYLYRSIYLYIFGSYLYFVFFPKCLLAKHQNINHYNGINS